MMRFAPLLFLAFGILAGCSHVDLSGSSQPDDPLRAALLRSNAVKQYIRSISSRWCCLPDGAVEGGVIVAVGEDMEDHFTRGLTVKVMDDGRVFIQTTREDGEEYWKPG